MAILTSIVSTVLVPIIKALFSVWISTPKTTIVSSEEVHGPLEISPENPSRSDMLDAARNAGLLD